MPKINQEEYEKIKLLPDYDWNWIAREKTGKILSFTNKPAKTDEVWKDKQTRLWFNYKDSQLFQFIQWGDEEPYNIAELIEEYENSYKGSWEHAIEFSKKMREESEETEVKKDLEWVRQEILREFEEEYRSKLYAHGFRDGLRIALSKINQLDEPEILSQEWIDEHKRVEGQFFVEYEVVPVKDLQNLLAPKQELPVIPQFVAEYLDFAKSDVPLMRVMELANTRNEWPKWKKEYDWISANDETFARAWLDGYTVEEEQKYLLKHNGKYLKSVKVKIHHGREKLEELNIHLGYTAKEYAQIFTKEQKEHIEKHINIELEELEE